MDNLKAFPKKKELRIAVLEALHNFGGTATTSEINNKVIEILNLSEDIVNIEHPDGLCTMLDYRLRWIRTELKKEGVLLSINRGNWKLNNI